jgi:hypothetical protein
MNLLTGRRTGNGYFNRYYCPSDLLLEEILAKQAVLIVAADALFAELGSGIPQYSLEKTLRIGKCELVECLSQSHCESMEKKKGSIQGRKRVKTECDQTACQDPQV